MIDAVILIPSILSAKDAHDDVSASIMRDAVLLGTVFSLHSIGVSLPRTVFVAAGLFVFASEIINDLTYKLLLPSVSLKKTWLSLQARQFRRDVVRYIELRNAKIHLVPLPDSNVLRLSNLGDEISNKSPKKVTPNKSNTLQGIQRVGEKR